jgi:hypothetical protein
LRIIARPFGRPGMTECENSFATKIGTPPPSRTAKRGRVMHHVFRPKRAWGMPGALRARSLVCEKVKHTSKSTTVAPGSPGIPARRLVLTVSFVLAPETGLFVSVASVMRSIIARLISASGYQAHTTSPSAFDAFVLRIKASTASRSPTCRDDRETPLKWDGTRGNVPLICPTSQASCLRHVGTTGKSECGWQVWPNVDVNIFRIIMIARVADFVCKRLPLCEEY